MTKSRIYCAFGYECNNNCLFCAVDSESHKNLSLSQRDVEIFLDKLNSMKDVELEFSGGEPTLSPALFYVLEALHANHPQINYVILTNGRSFSKISVAARLAELNPFSVLVPVHGDTAQLHDELTQSRGSFDETMLGIKNLYDYGITVGLKTIVNKLNYKHLPKLVELVARKFPDCPGIILNGLEIQGKALINKDIVGIRLRDAAPHVEAAIDVANEYGLKIIAYSIPPCVLGKDYWKFTGMKRRSTVISKTPLANMQRVKLTYGTVDKCSGCRYFGACTGAWYSYLDAYGTDELTPII